MVTLKEELEPYGTRDPETNFSYIPENEWLEYDPFLLGAKRLFSGA